LGCTKIGRERRAAIKPEPTEPEENGAEDDVSRVMRFIGESFCSESSTFSEIDG
jgi:hypothetical protein